MGTGGLSVLGRYNAGDGAERESAGIAAPRSLTPYQIQVREFFDHLAPQRDQWLRKNAFFYEQDRAFTRHLLPAGLSVLEIGCGNGQLLAALEPARGVGIDIAPKMVEAARALYPHLDFRVGNAEDASVIAEIEGTFDVIVISDTVGLIEDCEKLFSNLHVLCSPATRVVIAYYSHYWEPPLRLAEHLGLKMAQLRQNWLSTDDTINLLMLADFEMVKRDWRQLVPRRLLGLGALINRFVAPLPLFRKFCLRNYVVARPMPKSRPPDTFPSVSIVIPCRNERGNIEKAIRRLPAFPAEVEVLFVEGGSVDGTYDECLRVKEAYSDRNIIVLCQDGKGKGDAVRKGFAAARGDVLMILDSDLTVPPESLGKFYHALVSGKGELINGTRLIYPMGDGAMRFLNLIANRLFAVVFSYLLNQRITDALCGTKVLRRSDYERIAANRGYFGDLDPFGDFDLLFGASKLNLKITELPIRYAERTYGETQISRFSHGWLLARMVVLAWRKLKAF